MLFLRQRHQSHRLQERRPAVELPGRPGEDPWAPAERHVRQAPAPAFGGHKACPHHSALALHAGAFTHTVNCPPLPQCIESLHGGAPRRLPSLGAVCDRHERRHLQARCRHSQRLERSATCKPDGSGSRGGRVIRDRGEQRQATAPRHVSAISICSNDHTSRPLHAT